MKFSLAISALALSTTAVPTTVAAYNVGPGRFVSSPRGRVFARRCTGGRCAPTPMNGGCVDRAFDDLAAELNNGRQRQRRVGPPFRNNNNPWTQGLDEETLRQQQAWLNRAFGLAEDVAKSVASSPSEMEEADKAIRQSKEIADKMFGFVRGESPYQNYNDSKSSAVPSQILQDDQGMFEVSLDVPGVKESDLDVTVEGTKDKTLVVRGKRSVGKDETVDFSKTFPLTDNSAIDRMSASLENGVLVVSVPRISVEATETSKKIPLTPSSGASSDEQGEDGNQPFQLELDVPGVKESNIDIEVKGDTDKTLTIKAVRELGKDAEGNPRTTELSKEFQINELVDTSKIVAALSNGVLTVSAPVDEKKAEKSVKKVVVNGPPVAESTSVAPTTEDAVGDSDSSDATGEEGNESTEV